MAICFLSVVFFVSCSKDSANTRPSLTLKSFNPDVIPVNGNAQIRFTFGDIYVDLTYQNHLISATNPPTSGTPPRRQPDTLIFKFVLRDKAKNVSDTVVSSPIVVLR